jgi:phospholipid transport system substrate-binding protein
MKTMLRPVLVLLLAVFLPISVATAAVPQEAFIAKLGQDAITLLADKGITPAKRKAEFGRMLRTNFDLKTVGRFVLGRHWRTATPTQQAEYQRLFETMVVTVYTQRFDAYAGQQFEVAGSAPLGDSKGDVQVKSIIKQMDGPPVAVEWRVRSNAGQYQIVDVVVEGVSMSLTQRSDFDSVVAQGGVDGLIADLKNRVATGTTKSAAKS